MVAKKEKLDSDELPIITRPTWFDRTSEASVSTKDLDKATEAMRDDAGYAKNGWTPSTLAAYFKERESAQSDTILHRRPARPKRTNGIHNPHRWRK